MDQLKEQGSKAYLISIVMVAVLGGLLFGYDTAVISGAEKGLQAFFKTAQDFDYTDGWHGFTSASALIGCIIGSAISGFLATNLGRKKSLIIAGLLFFISALGSMDPEFLFFEYGNPTYSLLIISVRCISVRWHPRTSEACSSAGTSSPLSSVSWWCIS